MKKFTLSLMFMMAACIGVNAMSFERAQAEALYLTDKMAYELNLNDQQYNDAYEINLDYLLRIDSPSDLYGSCYSYRLNDLRCILHDWQYSLLMAADYFIRPVVWRAGGWFFPVYSYYNRGHFYYSRPSVWVSYYGGHSHAHHHAGFYVDRRPRWDGGLRGHDMNRPAPGMGGHRVGGPSHRPGGTYHGGGRSYHGGMNPGGGRSNPGGMNPGGGRSNPGSMNPGGGRSNPGGVNHGNSFDGSSSRMGGGSGRSGGPRGGSAGPSYGGGNRGGGSSSGGSRGGSFSGPSGGSRGGGFSGGRGGGSSRGGRR